MRLADETIILRLENEVLLLRPSLRVAMRLDRQYGGFQRVGHCWKSGWQLRLQAIGHPCHPLQQSKFLEAA